MITFTTPKLLEKGITTVQMEVTALEAGKSVMNLLAREGLNTDEAQPFTVSISAFDQNNELVAVIGTVSGVYHKETCNLVLDKEFEDSKQILYLDMLYIEKEYEECGVATNVLELLPKLINAELNAVVDAIMIAIVPLRKNDDGQIVQMEMNTEFFIKLHMSIKFYSKRGFALCELPFLLGKKVKKSDT